MVTVMATKAAATRIVDDDEECDLGAANSATGQCTPECMIAECGDGYLLDELEGCDDGNTDNSDECIGTCEVASCGDGYGQTGVEAVR